jgi:hypothetical protein
MRSRSTIVPVVAALFIAMAGDVAGAHAQERAAAAIPTGGGPASDSDFNGDGYDDLAIGAPFDDVAGEAGAGVVHVLYGSVGGLSVSAGPGAQFWHQNKLAELDQAEAGDHFGWALAPANFNGDGYGDLAIGVPGEDWEDPLDTLPPVVDSGGVLVLFGSPSGLTTGNARYLLAHDLFASGTLHTGRNEFGYALAALDDYANSAAGQDGHSELAVGMPGASEGEGGFALFGGNRVDPTAPPRGSYAVSGLWGAGARAGEALASGRFDATAGDDLAIGAPRADVTVGSTVLKDAGKVSILYGLDTSHIATFVQPGTSGDAAPEALDRFGGRLTAAYLNETDAYKDLAIGVPFEDVGARANAGTVLLFLMKSDGSGIDATTATQLSLDTVGVPGDPVAGDRFGSDVTVGDLGGSGLFRDIAVGVPGRDLPNKTDAGAVAVIYRSQNAIGDPTTPHQLWTQDSTGVSDVAETGDRFGEALFAGAFNGELRFDLAIGVPFEDLGPSTNAGIVHLLYGAAAGLSTTGQQVWYQDRTGVADTVQTGDRFGSSLR